MKHLVVYLVLFGSAVSHHGVRASPTVIDINLVNETELNFKSNDKVDVCAGQLYLLRLVGLNKNHLSQSEHAASVVGYPDLPKWNFIKPYRNDVLFYGSYPRSEHVKIQVISTDQETFETTDRRLQLNAQTCRTSRSNFEVEMKFINYNVEDIYEFNIIPKLEAVIRTLWTPDSNNSVFVSKLASVLDIGGRKPIDPRDKEGFVVRFGAEQNFSSELRNVELEVRQLRNRIPCPRDYKRTSLEWRFREIGLIPDWCGFQLFSDIGAERQKISPEEVQVLTLPPFDGPDLKQLPRRASTRDFLNSLVILFVICFGLLAGISGTSLCLYSYDHDTQQ